MAFGLVLNKMANDLLGAGARRPLPAWRGRRRKRQGSGGMRSRAELAAHTITAARDGLSANVRGLTIAEALQAGGGYRSILGMLKHTAAWSHVYHLYAFDAAPVHWAQMSWPRGLRDTIEPTQAYLDEVIAWLDASYAQWTRDLAPLADDAFDAPYRCHWGATAPLFDIVTMIVNHTAYHTGEINAVLSIIRGEAWSTRRRWRRITFSPPGIACGRTG